jgi:hypothetical protein
MKAKNKNPLYVVKGDDIEVAENLFDMLIKKLNLEPVVDFFMEIFKMLFEQINSYQAFMVLKECFDEFMNRVELFRKFSIV